MEDLAVVAINRIDDKIQNKVHNYINLPIWLIGYASKAYNIFLLTPHYDDHEELKIAEYISNNIISNPKVSSIWLAEFSNKNLLLEIKN